MDSALYINRIAGFYFATMDPKQQSSISDTTSTIPPEALEASDQDKDAEKDGEEYTVFSKPKRIFIAVIVSLAGLLSTFSSNVYYPALNEITKVCP